MGSMDQGSGGTVMASLLILAIGATAVAVIIGTSIKDNRR